MLIRDVTYLFLAAWVLIAAGGLSLVATSGGYSPAATSGGCSLAATSGGYSPAAMSGGCSLAAVLGPLIPVAPLVAQHCSRHSGSNSCGSQAREHDLSGVALGLSAWWHMGSSWTRDQTQVPCIAR